MKIITIGLLLAVNTFVVAIPTTTAQNLLVNGSFESAVAQGALPSASGFWRGDLVESINPLPTLGAKDGSRVLQFLATAATASTNTSASEQWQIVDLQAFAPDIRAGKLRADGSVWVTRVPGAADDLFAIQLIALAGDPADLPSKWGNRDWLQSVLGEKLSDASLASWEEITASLILPPTTRYLVVHIYAFENHVNDGVGTPEFEGHFADNASLRLTWLP